jgi:hypothetical protein
MALTPISTIANAKVWYLVALLASGHEELSAPMTAIECREMASRQELFVEMGGAYRVVDDVYWRVDDVYCRDSGGNEEALVPEH